MARDTPALPLLGALLGVLLSAPACVGQPLDTGAPTGSHETGETGQTGTTPSLAGACPLDQRLGGFTVLVTADQSGVQGSVADGVVPVTVLDTVQSAGDCQLVASPTLHCEPTCSGGETCGLDGVCVPYPQSQDLGIVSVDGLSQPVEMAPVQPGNTYYDTSLPHPAFGEGDAVALTLGGWTGAQSLAGVGSAALVPSQTEWTLRDGQALDLSWQPPADGTQTRVRLDLRIDQHGATPLRVQCSFDDGAGQGTVPAELITALAASGITGFPGASLRRHSVDSASVEVMLADGTDGGCVDFEVAWLLELELTVEGHTPCTSDLDCPEGQSCDLALETCVDDAG